MEHFLIALLLTLILVLWDLIPLLKNKKQEKKAVCFSVVVYAVSLLLNILIGAGVPITLGQDLATLFSSVLKVG